MPEMPYRAAGRAITSETLRTSAGRAEESGEAGDVEVPDDGEDEDILQDADDLDDAADVIDADIDVAPETGEDER